MAERFLAVEKNCFLLLVLRSMITKLVERNSHLKAKQKYLKLGLDPHVVMVQREGGLIGRPMKRLIRRWHCLLTSASGSLSASSAASPHSQPTETRDGMQQKICKNELLTRVKH
jgi:hypothetical protein